MAGNPGREIDKTHLSIDMAEERCIIHRDYLAHCLRWSHVARHVGKLQASKHHVCVLDVGCGREVPLAKTLYTNRMAPYGYLGVDANVLETPHMLRRLEWLELLGGTDFTQVDTTKLVAGPRGMEPNVVVCFECLEHVAPSKCREMVVKMRDVLVLSLSGRLFVSTPCWNGSAADNHVNEMTYEALGALLEDVGLRVRGVWGTFASIGDYQKLLTDAQREMFVKLHEYYDTNALSVLFAPLFPEVARNCLWELVLDGNVSRRFPRLSETPGPWSQHPDWRELAG